MVEASQQMNLKHLAAGLYKVFEGRWRMQERVRGRLNGQMEPLGWPRQGPPSMQCTQPQLLFLPILQFFPSVSTISSKSLGRNGKTVSQYFHCFISNESLWPDKKGEQIMLCRLDLYSHNGTEIKPKNHVVPIDPRKPR